MKIEIQGNFKIEEWHYKFVATALQNAKIKYRDVVVKLDDSSNMVLTVDGKENAFVIYFDNEPIDSCQDGSKVHVFIVYEKYGEKEDDVKELYIGYWNTTNGYDEHDAENDDEFS